jgi:ATP:ADP antiporter, AAA family
MTSYLERTFNVRREELGPVLLSGLFFFLILTGIMVLRPARDALGMQRGIEAIRWLFIGTALVTLAVNPLFGWLVSRFRRLLFITATYAFFIASLVGFYLLLVLTPQAVGETTGQVFYVWFSVFNLFVTMVFWALMADRFSLEQSKRFFAVIAAGGTLGAIFGPWLAAQLAVPLGTPSLLLVSAAFLALATATAWAVAYLQPESARAATAEGIAAAERPPAVDERAVIGGSAWGGFRAALRSPYLLGISGYVLILTVVATFIYFTRLQLVAALGDDVDMRTTVFAQIDLVVQITTLFLQLVVAGHLMKRIGVGFTLALLPIVAVLGFVGLAIASSLVIFVLFDAAFRAVQRALVRPARETLFTVVGREDKYKSKAFIDTFVYRTGDVVGAQLDGLLARLGMGVAALTIVTVPLAVVWAGLGLWLGREQRRRSAGPPPVPGRETRAAFEAGADAPAQR